MTQKGSEHYKWNGGKPKCEICGSQLSRYGLSRCRKHRIFTDLARANMSKAHLGIRVTKGQNKKIIKKNIKCSVGTCPFPQHSRGVCNGHYSRLRIWGELRPEIPLKERINAAGQLCKTIGCNRPVKSKMYCGVHYNRVRVSGSDNATKPIKHIRYDWGDICSVPECGKPSRKMGRCEKHYLRFRTTGTDVRPGHCDICLKECTPVWDHCHKTGIFRGWLCRACNLILGSVQDDVSMLNRMINYLEKDRH